MHRLIVRNAKTGEGINSKPMDITKLPASFHPRRKILEEKSRTLAKESGTELANSDLRYVLISHSNRAVAEGKL
jgi:hypothetical protein